MMAAQNLDFVNRDNSQISCYDCTVPKKKTQVTQTSDAFQIVILFGALYLVSRFLK